MGFDFQKDNHILNLQETVAILQAKICTSLLFQDCSSFQKPKAKGLTC